MHDARDDMEITAERRPGGVVLRLAGELDALAAPGLTLAVESVIASGARRVVVDLAHVRFCGSTGIESLVRAARALAEVGGALAVARASPFCRGVLEAVGLERLVTLFRAEEDAARWLRGRPGAAVGG